MRQRKPAAVDEGLHRSMLQLSISDEGGAPPPKPFPFFNLPAELRTRIYEFALLPHDRLVDLDPNNFRRIAPRLKMMLVSKQMQREAARVFFGLQIFRLFPLHGRFSHTKLPLLARLTQEYRGMITAIELRLGPGWTSPPQCQKVDDGLGLHDCTSLRTVKIFVEIDPSQDIFNGFRGLGKGKESYKVFCVGLLADIMARAPSIVTVEIDAYPSVGKESPLILGLVTAILAARKRLVWGPLRGWYEDADCGRLGLESALAGMSL